MTQKTTPIIYQGTVDVRFADLDHYNHVNSSHFIDLVATSRIVFMEKEMNTSIEQITSRGIGFFMTKSTVHYRRPIDGLQKVYIKSHVEEVRAEKVLVIPFKMTNEDESKLFAEGTLEFAVVDMKTKRTTPMPEWGYDLFLRPIE